MSAFDSERLPQADVQRASAISRAAGELVAVHLEPDVDADRSDRRSVADAEADGAAQLA